MSTNALKTAATGQQTQPRRNDSFPALIDQLKKQVAVALPKHLNADRMARIALTAFNSNKQLRECDPISIFAAVVTAAQLGLEPGVQGQCYLIPYNGICQLVPGWKGLLDLANRSGRSSAWTGSVYRGDEFSFTFGTDPKINHVPKFETFRDDDLTHVYSVGRVRGAEWPVIEIWPMAKIWAHRDHYNKVGKRHYSYANPEMYARKIPLLQVLKYLPTSVELQTALDLEHSAADGSQSLNMQNAIDGSFIYAPTDGENADAGADTDGGQPRFTNVSAAEALRSAPDLITLNKAWSDIKVDFHASDVGTPPADVEAVFNVRRKAFGDGAP